jgi:hypothetical protein
MFRSYIQPSSGLKEISPGTKSVYFMASHIQGQFQNQPLIGWLEKYKTENKTVLYGTVSYIHNCITFPHSCRPHLGTCRTVTLVFVVPLQRTVLPSNAAKSVSCVGTHRAQNIW